jgi:hypothetical protein
MEEFVKIQGSSAKFQWRMMLKNPNGEAAACNELDWWQSIASMLI